MKMKDTHYSRPSAKRMRGSSLHERIE